MKIGGLGGIDPAHAQNLLSQLKAQATPPSMRVAKPEVVQESTKVSFSDALKAQLDQVAAAQTRARELTQAFSAGDENVSLSDAMIASQKAGIAFQGTVQVRNKLLTAYQEIMNMQV
ncbi:flagellar hook-basal body complex protein FliE [Massilia sp. W12]|uniref:flagellar hook-basal body complex protein FliE n=1 Tax=Massilia sp. W12 TaxID=3126507 RepID=UPI0030D178B7